MLERAGDIEGAERLLCQAVDAGRGFYTLEPLAELREKAGDIEGAERLAWQAALTAAHGQASMRVLYVRARMPIAEETRALGLGDINPIIETSRITTFQNGPPWPRSNAPAPTASTWQSPPTDTRPAG